MSRGHVSYNGHGEFYEEYDMHQLDEEENYNGIYDNEIREVDTKKIPQASNPQPTTVITITKQQTSKSLAYSKWKLASGICGVLAAAAVAVIIYLSIRVSELSSSQDNDISPSSGDVANDLRVGSCQELMTHRLNASGIKTLRLSDNVEAEVYCDMETDGGGWTLVASIHESDIKAKCAIDDRWSSYVPSGSNHSNVSNRSWENEDTFGNVRSCLVDDYKSSAYYILNASDVMVWHVQWASQIESMKMAAKLRYRSTSQFLQRYGGNLKNLFNDHFPLSPAKSLPQNWVRLREILQVLPEIKMKTRGWFDYKFTAGKSDMNDSNLYNGFGNRISLISTRHNISDIRYGVNYQLSCASEISSASTTGQPFGLLLMVKNQDSLTEYYSLDVYSRRTTEPSNITEISETRSFKNFQLHYKALQFYQPSGKLMTECRFHFYVSNNEDWKSKSPTKFWNNYRDYTSDVRQTIYAIEGSPSRILFGYVLLSKEAGQSYSENDTNAVADLILRKLPIDLFADEWRTLAVPVTFDQGSADVVSAAIPPDMRSTVEAGQLQLRAYNSYGYPNALCPGVRVTGDSPEYVCVGGVSSDISKNGTCGDYGGWDGKLTDERSDRSPVGHAHSSQDILSTILIFYR